MRAYDSGVGSGCNGKGLMMTFKTSMVRRSAFYFVSNASSFSRGIEEKRDFEEDQTFVYNFSGFITFIRSRISANIAPFFER